MTATLSGIYIILGCLSIIVEPSFGQCPVNKANILSCEQTVIELVTSRLMPYGKTFHTIDLKNSTEEEWLTEKTKEVVCSASNAPYVSCLLTNITSCPQLVNDSDISSTWIASLIIRNPNILNSVSAICKFFSEVTCSYKEARFNTCYFAMLGEVIVENAVYGKDDICQPNRRDNLTCMIQSYKQCYTYFNLTGNNNININIRVMMLENQWETFNTGMELCDCYEGADCYDKLQAEINTAITPATSVTDSYNKTIALSEILCRNISQVNCSVKGRQQACQNVLKEFTSSRTKIDVYKSAVDSICDDVQSDDFIRNKRCIIQKLADVYHPCVVEADIPVPPTNCGDVRTLYTCTKSALNGQCNGDFVETAYDIVRSSLGNVPVCATETVHLADVFMLMIVSVFLIMC